MSRNFSLKHALKGRENSLDRGQVIVQLYIDTMITKLVDRLVMLKIRG